MPSALVTKLRKDPKVRDAEALAAWISRYQKLRKAGVSNKKAMKLAGKEGGMKEGGVKKADRKTGGGKGGGKDGGGKPPTGDGDEPGFKFGNIESRKKMYEAKEDAYKWLEGKDYAAVEIYEIDIPGKNREYVAVPKIKANEGIEKKFPGKYKEVDYITESDAKRRRRR